MSHRSGLPFCWAVLVLLGVCSLMLFAQDNPQSGQTGNHPTVSIPLQLNLTGCLKKSASGAYSVTDQNGRNGNSPARRRAWQSTYFKRSVFQDIRQLKPGNRRVRAKRVRARRLAAINISVWM